MPLVLEDKPDVVEIPRPRTSEPMEIGPAEAVLEDESPVGNEPKLGEMDPAKRNHKKKPLPPGSPKPFPPAPRSVARFSTVEDQKFFDYWVEVAKEFPGRVVVYIQRLWPVLDYYNALTTAQRSQFEREYPEAKRKPEDIDVFLRRNNVFKYLEKFAKPFDSPDWRSEILRRHGSGDYKIFLKDLGVEGTACKEVNICHCKPSLRDENYPPLIDITLLDMFDPANAVFIQERRMRGLELPDSQQRAENESEEMSAVTQQLLDTNEKLTTRLLEVKPASATLAPAAAPAPAADAAHAVEKVTEAFGKASERMLEMVTRTAEAQAKANDPVAFHEKVMAAAGTTGRPAGESGGESAEVRQMQRLLEMEQRHSKDMIEILTKNHAAETAALNSRLTSLEKMISDQRAAPAASLSAQLEDMVKLQVLAKKLAGHPESEEDAETPGWAGIVERLGEKLFDNMPVLMDGLKHLRAQPAPGEGAKSVQTVEVTKVQEDPAVVQERMFANQMKPHIIEAIKNGFSGAQFAGNLIESYGLPVYQQLTVGGEQGLTNVLLRTGLQADLIAMFGPPKISHFIAEFCEAEKAKGYAQEIARVKASQQPPVGTQPPPNGAPGPKVNRAQ